MSGAPTSEWRAEWEAACDEFYDNCTCPDEDGHDDEAECPCSPECICGEFFNPHCARHGDPEPLS